MRTKFTWVDAVMLVVCGLPLIYLWFEFPLLPARVAIHFNLQGNADRYGSRQELLYAILLLCGVTMGVALLVRFLPDIDPKKKSKYSQPVFVKIGYAVLFFLSGVSILIINSTVAGHLTLDQHILFSFIALFLAYLGNLFNNLKPNYFVGIRTPWTLENETVWKKTHQLGGRIWLLGGLLVTILCWVLPPKAAFITFYIGVAAMAIVPVVFSYFYYRQLQKKTL